MIQEQTMLGIADNSDIRRIMCIEVLSDSHRCYTGVDDIIKIIIREAIPRGKVKESDVLKAVVVRTGKGVRRSDGPVVRFDGNTYVILSDNSGQPIGTRVFELVARELRTGKFMRIVPLVPEVLQKANHDSQNPL